MATLSLAAQEFLVFLSPALNEWPPRDGALGYPEARDEFWYVYYGDVHAGTLAICTGNPHDTDPWE